MTLRTFVAALSVTVLAGTSAFAQRDDLTAVRDLYASASYEEALTYMSKAGDGLKAEVAEQYRALCLLGLGRATEAERALERLVTASPMLTLKDDDVPPRLIAMHHDVRRRLLPVVARDLYAQSKENYDKQNYLAASAQLRELMSILNDEDMADQVASFTDLRMLAEGFLKLTNAELVLAAKEAAAAAPPPPPVAPVAAAAPAKPAIYADSDSGVTLPVEVSRRLPPWNPPPTLANMEYRGILEVVINEKGMVESAILQDPVTPLYDRSLLQATSDWRFQPATKGGEPVKFRKTFQILLSGR